MEQYIGTWQVEDVDNLNAVLDALGRYLYEIGVLYRQHSLNWTISR